MVRRDSNSSIQGGQSGKVKAGYETGSNQAPRVPRLDSRRNLRETRKVLASVTSSAIESDKFKRGHENNSPL